MTKLKLNVFDRVLATSAVNTDAESVVQALSQEDIAYEKLGDVIEMTIAQCRTDGYLYKDAKDVVVLSVMSILNSKTNTLAKALAVIAMVTALSMPRLFLRRLTR